MAGQNEISPFNSFRILSYYSEAKAILEGKIPFPRMAIIYPSYMCNHHCVYCFYKKDIDAGILKYMKYDDFMRIVEQLNSVGVQGIELCGGGEPLTNPHIHKILKDSIEKYSFKWGLLTNGGLLDNELIELIVKNFSYIRISLDDIHKYGHNYKRKPNQLDEYNKIFTNITNMLILKDKYNTNIKIGIKILLLKCSEEAIMEYVYYANNIGLDSVQIKVAEYENVQFILNDVFANSEKLEFIIDSLRENSIPILATVRKTLLTKPCWLSPLQTTIDVNGDVYICCYFQHRREEHRIGNMLEQPFTEFWGSQKHRDAISKISIDKCNTWNCRFHKYNAFMEKAVKEDLMQLEFC